MTTQSSKPEQNSNQGFLFGLTLGATIGAISAILVHKNNKAEIVDNFESKIKDFFRDLINDAKTKKENISRKIEFIDAEPEEDEEEKPHIVHKKSHPKMFVKPKR
jgi:gas vesicle protein